MIDLRPVGYILGRLLLLLGLLMLIPAALDWMLNNANAEGFIKSALFTSGVGAVVVLTTRNGIGAGLGTRKAFLLTLLIWTVIPLFAALPFIVGAPGMGLTNAYFEAVSGITSTGSTVIVGLEGYPEGMNLWRGMLNWLGGLGIAFIAMIFLPVMRVGGMQFFRTEGFDTLGKILPRASDIALSLLGVYAGLTVVCALSYSAIGMTPLDAVVHAMASISTGGFSPSDASFGKYQGAGEYVGALFMILGSLPYVRYVQLVNGTAKPFYQDLQIRAYLSWIAGAVLIVTLWRVTSSHMALEPAFRETLFNLVAVFSGTGFASGGFAMWGGFALLVVFVLGFVGGCSGSSSGALSVFRVQVMLAAIAAQVRQITSPNRIVAVKYGRRTVEDDVMNALMLYVTGYILTLGVLSVAMTLVGVDSVSALFGIWSSLGNIGFEVGPMVTETGTYIDFPAASKWLMVAAMLMGRLALLSVFVVVMPSFWQR